MEPATIRRWYHILMKLFVVFALCAVSMVSGAVNPQLKQVSTVYILSMGSGMDQYLANRLTGSGVFQVVADPQRADAIMTDRLGESFENKLNELYPPAIAHVAKDDAKDKNSMDAGPLARITPSSRGKGNIFVVDRKSRNVIWSVYERPKDTTATELDRTAEKVVKRLKTDLSEK
jgi:hypothetical protein